MVDLLLELGQLFGVGGGEGYLCLLLANLLLELGFEELLCFHATDEAPALVVLQILVGLLEEFLLLGGDGRPVPSFVPGSDGNRTLGSSGTF